MKFSAMKFTLRRQGENRGWPDYLFWGRMRTSTFGLIVAFIVTAWLFETYRPPPPEPTPPEMTQVVPPGFVPDPEYTWVPRTSVRTYPPRTTTTTPTTTPTTTMTPPPTNTTSPTETSGPPVVPAPGEIIPTPETPTTELPTTRTPPNPFMPTPPTPQTPPPVGPGPELAPTLPVPAP